MADIKEVVWHSEYGEGLFPFCPYCDEYAYEEDHCVFCKKPYKWADSPIKDTIVKVGNLIAVQTSGNGIYVSSEKGMVAHIICENRMTEDELRKILKILRGYIDEG